MQDLFAGAWQQADPEIDQVPYTFPPVHGPSKMGRGRRARRGIFRGRGKPRQNGGQAAGSMGRGRGFAEHHKKLLPRPPKPPKGRGHWAPPQPMPKRGVSTADYAMALDQELWATATAWFTQSFANGWDWTVYVDILALLFHTVFGTLVAMSMNSCTMMVLQVGHGLITLLTSWMLQDSLCAQGLCQVPWLLIFLAY